MKQFKEFRMPPITMGRDNITVGVRDHDIPGSIAQKEMAKAAAAKIKKKFTFKKPKGFKIPGSETAKKLAEGEIQQISDLISKGMNAKQIAKKIGRTATKEINAIAQMIKLLTMLKQTEAIEEGEIGDIEKLMKKGMNAKQIGKKKGYSPRRIKALAGMMQLMKQLQQNEMKEGKITWKRGELTDGTMQIGIFDKDKEKALEAARQLIIFLRKNKRTKIGGDKEDSDGQPNEAIAKYSEELSKLVFDDELLDDLEPNGSNADQTANDIVFNRLRDLGVNIR